MYSLLQICCFLINCISFSFFFLSSFPSSFQVWIGCRLSKVCPHCNQTWGTMLCQHNWIEITRDWVLGESSPSNHHWSSWSRKCSLAPCPYPCHCLDCLLLLHLERCQMDWKGLSLISCSPELSYFPNFPIFRISNFPKFPLFWNPDISGFRYCRNFIFWNFLNFYLLILQFSSSDFHPLILSYRSYTLRHSFPTVYWLYCWFEDWLFRELQMELHTTFHPKWIDSPNLE